MSGSGEVSPSQGWQRGWQGGERFGVTAAPPGPGSRQPAAWGAAGSVEALWGRDVEFSLLVFKCSG